MKNECPVEEISFDLEPLVDNFIKNSFKDLEEIKMAIGQKDYETLGRLGHNVKGSAYNYGFDILAGIGKKIEKAAAFRDDSKLESGIAEFEQYLERVQVVFKD